MFRLFLVVFFALVSMQSAHADQTRLRTRFFAFTVESARVAMIEELAANADDTLLEVVRQLGVAPPEGEVAQGTPSSASALDTIQVRVVHTDEDFIEAMPNHRNIEWAAGVAFPRQGIIVLRIDARTRFEIHDVFRHEMSHVVLGRATRQADLPIWFVEGVAVHQAGEQIRERWQKAADATLTESLPSLLTITESFPADGASADFAYAHSTAFLSHLLRNGGWAAVRTLIAKVAAGSAFGEAFASTYGRPLAHFEAGFREEIAKSASWLPIIFGSTVLTAAAGIVFLALAWQRRKRTRARLERMPEPLDDEFA